MNFLYRQVTWWWASDCSLASELLDQSPVLNLNKQKERVESKWEKTGFLFASRFPWEKTSIKLGPLIFGWISGVVQRKPLNHALHCYTLKSWTRSATVWVCVLNTKCGWFGVSKKTQIIRKSIIPSLFQVDMHPMNDTYNPAIQANNLKSTD